LWSNTKINKTMGKEQNNQEENKSLHIGVVSNSFICDSCEKTKDNNESVMINDEWFICKSCFEKESIQICEYSAYCALTGECDESC